MNAQVLKKLWEERAALVAKLNGDNVSDEAEQLTGPRLLVHPL